MISQRMYLALLGLSTLALSACGGGDGGSAAPAPPEVARPPPDSAPPTPDVLLSDAQLQTGADANAARVDDDAAAWFAANAKTVRSLTVDDDFSDLDFLADVLESKRLVALGESSHGVKQFSQAKVRLIKYLHEALGFNLLAFEGGLFDCEYAQGILERGLARDAMNSCLFSVWQTAELRELFDYLVSTQSTATPLRITGFDVQFSGVNSDQRPAELERMVAKVSPAYAEEVLELEQRFFAAIGAAQAATSASSNAITSLTDAVPGLQVDYTTLSDYLLANETIIVGDGEYTPLQVRIAAQYTRTAPFFASQLAQRFTNTFGASERDRGMGENLIALATQIYPQEKIIAWAHNAHLRHQGTGFLPDANMGVFVHDLLEPQLYTVGFYMYRGQHAFNDRSVQQVLAPLNFSLEAIFHSRRLAYLFLDIEGADPDAEGGAWLRTTTPTWEWGSEQTPLTLSEEYDGVLVIDTVTPPDYL
ncbi:MAG: erythromycin esterase family protein [Pseudomonadota bacterium]